MMETVEINIPRDPVIEAYKKDIDRTLLRENLRLTVEQRFDNLMQLQDFAQELRKAGRKFDDRDLRALLKESGHAQSSITAAD
jgi:hypothetical protein